MPARNKVKNYVENGYYHIYNRGVEKRVIFTDKKDASVFLSYLKEYLIPKETEKLVKILNDPEASSKEKIYAASRLRMNNFSDEIDLLCYCLMPNHFHLLVKQNNPRAIEQFMRSLCTRYVQYFNQKNDRVGGLFQDTYKAVLVKNEKQLIWLSRYIHRNPIGIILKGLTLKELPSSYSNFLGLINQSWLKPDEILNYFSKTGFNSYKLFVEDSDNDEKALRYIEGLILD